MAFASGSSDVPADLKDRLRATYDTIAPTYNKWTEGHASLRLHYLDQLFAALPASSGLSVLELGCGSGVPVTQKLVEDERFALISANDLSPVQVAIAKGKLDPLAAGRITWLEGDMSALSFEPRSLDAVLGFYSLIHLPREEQATMLDKIAIWLKAGGYMLANFALEDEESVVNEQWLSKDGWTFWSGYGVEKTLEKTRATGLEILVKDVGKGDGVDSGFLWLLARKPE